MIREGAQNAFVREFGRMAFDCAARNPEYASVFDQAMSSYSGAETARGIEAVAGRGLSEAGLFGIHMMCWGAGRERTSEEYVARLERAGWR